MKLHRLMIYADKGDTKGRNEIKKIIAKAIDDYDYGQLADVTEDQLKNLKKAGISFEELKDATKIKLRAVHFDTSEEAPVLPDVFSVAKKDVQPAGRRTFWIIQFIGPVKNEWKENLEKERLNRYRMADTVRIKLIGRH